jgi:hypothetical protein
MEVGLPGACEHWCPKWPTRSLSGNEIARALISMMARSNELQAEAGYICARPLCQLDETLLRCTAGAYIRVRSPRDASRLSPSVGPQIGAGLGRPCALTFRAKSSLMLHSKQLGPDCFGAGVPIRAADGGWATPP